MKSLLRKLIKVAMVIVVVILVVIAIAFAWPAFATTLTSLAGLAAGSEVLLLAKLAIIALGTFFVCMLIDSDTTMKELNAMAAKVGSAAAAVVSGVAKPVISAIGAVASTAARAIWPWILGAYLLLTSKGKEKNADPYKPVRTSDLGKKDN